MAPKSNRPTERLADLDKAPRIEKMREQGKTWAEIAEKLNMTAGRAQFIVLAAGVKPKDRIKYTDLDDAGKKIVAARDKDKVAWPLLAARIGLTEGRVKDIYRRVKAGGSAAGERGKRSNGAKAKPAAKRAAKAAVAAKKTGRASRPKGNGASKRSKRVARKRAAANPTAS